MENEKLLLDIGSELEIFRAHIKRLRKKPANVHSLDVDLLQEKTRRLYEKLIDLEISISGKTETTIATQPVQEEPPEPETVFEDTLIETEIKAEVVQESSSIEPEIPEETVSQPEPVNVTKEVVTIHESEPEIMEKTVVAELEKPEIIPPQPDLAKEEEKEREVVFNVVEETKAVEQPDPVNEIREQAREFAVEEQQVVKSTIDLFSDSVEKTIADKLGSPDNTSIANKMQQSQIGDLRQAIGINEKFLFINGLFNGDLGRYNKAIDDFNELTTGEGIDAHLLELKIQNQWLEENEGFVKLKALLDRKFN